MIELVVAVCMIDQPSRCKDVTLNFDIQLSPNQCTVAAMPHLAEWVGEHPNWVIQKWHCARAGEFAKL